jgi:ubiquinone/menaquinone biosynthesis C-methylase UbiE
MDTRSGLKTLIYGNITMAEIEYRDSFKQNVDAYEKIVGSKHIQLIYHLEKGVLARYFDEIQAQDKSVMDFACGSGRWTQFLETQFATTVAVDVSEGMIDKARSKCQSAEFVVTDITSESVSPVLQDRQFDVITAFRFYKNAQTSLRESATRALPRYLKDGGLFIFDLHLNTFSLVGILARIMSFLRLPKLLGVSELWLRTISLSTIRRLFAGSDFEIVDYYGMGILPGRSNWVILPRKSLYAVEEFFTRRKLGRGMSYNILVIARKTSSS